MAFTGLEALGAGAGAHAQPTEPFPRELDSYQDEALEGIWAKIIHRAEVEPFNAVATLIFFLAIGHTFVAGYFRRLAHTFEHEHHEKVLRGEIKKPQPDGPDPVCLKATIFHFLGEVEAIFGIWLIPLLASVFIWYDWEHVYGYIDKVSYTEPIFVVIIMSIAASRPVIQFAEKCTAFVANLFGGGLIAWWASILCILPLMGSFITEPAAMTIAAVLLADKFYDLNPSTAFKYATLGALFVSISVGGTLTHFAAPPVLMVARAWELDTVIMLGKVGWKAFLGILVLVALTSIRFRKELQQLDKTFTGELSKDRKRDSIEPVPRWIVVVHMSALAWTVLTLHHPPLVVGGFLFFLAFTTATVHHQYQISLRAPVLVGFFLAGLVTHGGFQSWWIAPVLSELSKFPLFVGSIFLTAFNDNAAITYLASLVPAFDPHLATDLATAKVLEYAVLTGAVTGGGLTVIANAPNPAGQSILNKYFDNGVSPLGLLKSALIPTIIVALIFYLTPGF